MIELTDFQEVVGLALDILDKQAAKVQKSWPDSERKLRKALTSWRTLTNSSISGMDLLRICKDVWKQRPDDLALTEGRTILYHPLSGVPIAENSPLDGIPVETLAFLRWSIAEGYLDWTDEVTIVREVKGANSIIFDMPSDRFYGKNSLPLTSGGEIDWSNVGLAEAKSVIETGMVRAKPSPSPLYYSDDTLEGVLCAIPALREKMNRDRLLRGMPPGAVGSMSRSSAFGTDIANIIVAVEGFGRLSGGQPAIDALIDNAIKLTAGTSKATKLISFKVD